jgi:hypothetical protein
LRQLPTLSAGAVIGPDDGCRTLRSPLLPNHDLIDRGAAWGTPVIIIDRRSCMSTPSAPAIQLNLVGRGFRAILLVPPDASAIRPDIGSRLVEAVLDAVGLARAHLITLSDEIGFDAVRHPRLWSSRIIARMASEVQVIWIGTPSCRDGAGADLSLGRLLRPLQATCRG